MMWGTQRLLWSLGLTAFLLSDAGWNLKWGLWARLCLLVARAAWGSVLTTV